MEQKQQLRFLRLQVAECKNSNVVNDFHVSRKPMKQQQQFREGLPCLDRNQKTTTASSFRVFLVFDNSWSKHSNFVGLADSAQALVLDLSQAPLEGDVHGSSCTARASHQLSTTRDVLVCSRRGLLTTGKPKTGIFRTSRRTIAQGFKNRLKTVASGRCPPG